MGIELISAAADARRVPRFLDRIHDLFRGFVRLFVWKRLTRHVPPDPELSSKTPLLLDCEKGYVDVYHARAQVIAALRRRDAADAAFETQVHAILAPVKRLLAEINADSGIHEGTNAPFVDRIHRSLEPTHAYDHETPPELPPAPQIFCGREQELAALIDIFTPPRQVQATLTSVEGAGTSTLALAFLHRPEVVCAFGTRRFLVRCTDSTDDDVAALASALGLHPMLALATLAVCPHQTLVVLDGAHDTTVDMLTALAHMRNVSLLLATRVPAEARRFHNFTEIRVGPLPLPAARALFRAIADLPLCEQPRGDVEAAAAFAGVPVDSLPTPAEAEQIPVHSTDAADVDANSNAALVDALLNRAGCLPRTVGELARRAQYEPLPFLLGCLEEGDVRLS
ncbi:hypothetical protein C8R46DRAFT_2839 [Mycena filopes]|nr:hypothetical protein C8R46DRAFT_2839 [Mycena filopes]